MLDPLVLKTYRSRLTNLTGRNRSLLLTTLSAGQFLDLHDADFLLNRPSFDVIAQLLARRPVVPVCDVLDARSERVNAVSKRLRQLARTAELIEAERGTQDLYVGWPFVRGKFMDGTVVHGPLLFFPVNITQTGNRWQLTHRGSDHPDNRPADAPAIRLNTAFALAYGHFNQVRIGDDVLEKEVADFAKDPLTFRTQLYEWLKTTPLELNFNPDLFADILLPFDRQTGKNLGLIERTGELKLYPEAVLGIFPQAGSYLVPDYDALIDRTATPADAPPVPSDAAEALDLAGPNRLIREEHLHTPLPLDASQEAALRAVKAGESVVVQGPPGTGKSQLITNLMADAAADGKRVLLVCQKRAALDVVYNRLRAVGMAPFVALIHDFQTDRPALYGQLTEQIADVEPYRTQNNSLDAVVLERQFDTESRRIDQVVSELEDFKNALFDTTTCGISVKELYLLAADAGSVPAVALPTLYAYFRFDQIDTFLRQLADYAANRQRLGTAHPFAERVSFGGFGITALSAAERAIGAIPEMTRLVSAETGPLFGQPLTLPALATWHENAWMLTTLLTLAEGPDAETRWPLARLLLMNPAHPARLLADAQLTTLADAWEATLTAPGPETTLPAPELAPFRLVLTSALDAWPSWTGRTWWQLTHPGRQQLARVLAANALPTAPADLLTLAQRVDRRIDLEDIHRQTAPLLALSPALAQTPAGLRLLGQARELADRLGPLTPLLTFLPAVWETFAGFAGAVRQTIALADTVQTNRATWRTYLTDAQTVRAWMDPSCARTLRQALRRDFDVLVETDRQQTGFSATETAVIDQLADWPPADWVVMFRAALGRHWIEHIEERQPVLRSVSSLKMTQMEAALQESVAQKQRLSRDILLVKLREQTYRDLTVNRLNNLVSYRDLQHQVTKNAVFGRFVNL